MPGADGASGVGRLHARSLQNGRNSVLAVAVVLGNLTPVNACTEISLLEAGRVCCCRPPAASRRRRLPNPRPTSPTSDPPWTACCRDACCRRWLANTRQCSRLRACSTLRMTRMPAAWALWQVRLDMWSVIRPSHACRVVIRHPPPTHPLPLLLQSCPSSPSARPWSRRWRCFGA